MNISDLAATNMSNIIDSMFDDDGMGVLLDPIAMGQAINATASPAPTVPIYRGFLFLLGSSFLWGSNYVPVKHFETGDGMFFQFIVCIGIWLVGFIVFWLRQFPKFYVLPLLGGFLWSTGNVNSVPIIKTIGLALGMLIWNVVGLVTGWATARFGLFGLEKDVPSNVVLNFIGVALAASSTVLYLFVRADMSHGKLKPSEITITNDSEKDTESGVEKKNSVENHENHDGILGRQSLRTKRIIGSVLAIFSGIMYGQYNTPILYTNQQFNKEGNYLDMLFCFYTGILLSSLGYFLIYCLIKKNNPRIYPKTIIPGLVSGVMWGLATICYFNATDILNQATSFPIASSGPPIFSSLWSILLYKEIKGSRNFAILFVGFLIAITGSILIGLSF